MAGNLPGYANATAVKNALDLAGTATQPADLTAYQATSEKGAADGYASLDATGKVPSAQIPASASDFVSLTDTPADYSGAAGKLIKVNPTGDALIFGDPSGSSVAWGDITGTISAQTDLTPAAIGAAPDTALQPADIATGTITPYTGDLDFNSLGGSGASDFVSLTDTPADYSGASEQVVRVNTEGTALEYHTLTASDVGAEPADATILKDADIGVSVQAYDADTAKTNTAQTWTAKQTFGATAETWTALSGTTPSITAGSHTWTLTGASTPTDGLSDGDHCTLMIDDGSASTIDWSSVVDVWIPGAAPALRTTGYTPVVLWKIGTTVYGSHSE